MKRFAALVGVISFFWAAAGWGAEVRLGPARAASGQTIDIPVTADRVERLAGVKLVIAYDADALTFRAANKTPRTQALMHIVNDKKPGRLVIVMAGARGIGGQDVRLLTLTFQGRNGAKRNPPTRIDILECQLMGEDLKEIKATTRGCAVPIAPP